mgnify:CR=1 FL=1
MRKSNDEAKLYKKHLCDLAWKMAIEADAHFMIVEADPPFVSAPEEASDYFTDEELEDYISMLEENELSQEPPQFDMNMEM